MISIVSSRCRSEFQSRFNFEAFQDIKAEQQVCSQFLSARGFCSDGKGIDRTGSRAHLCFAAHKHARIAPGCQYEMNNTCENFVQSSSYGHDLRTTLPHSSLTHAPQAMHDLLSSEFLLCGIRTSCRALMPNWEYMYTTDRPALT